MTKIKMLIFAGLFVALTGCAAEVNAIRQSIGLYGANAADQALESGVWAICNGSTVGATQRRFKTTAEKSAYRDFCNLP